MPERPGFRLNKGVGLRSVELPKPEPNIVSQLISSDTAPPGNLEQDPANTAENTAANTAANTVANTAVKPTANGTAATKTKLAIQPGARRPRKPRSTTVTFRFPIDMADRLRRIANYNNVSQTAILLEALDIHLPSFPQPPENWESE